MKHKKHKILVFPTKYYKIYYSKKFKFFISPTLSDFYTNVLILRTLLDLCFYKDPAGFSELK